MFQWGAFPGKENLEFFEQLPIELWLCILDYLCPHCLASLAHTPGISLVEDHNGIAKPLLLKSRGDLLSVNLTCQFFRSLAQKYLFYCFDRETDNIFSRFRRSVEPAGGRPDLSGAVKEMTVSSNPGRRGILEHLPHIRTLKFRIDHGDGQWTDDYRGQDVLFGNNTLTDKLQRLQKLILLPTEMHRSVHISRGRLWLEALMKAGPELQSLSIRRFVDFSHDADGLIIPAPNNSPKYLKLPENKVTKLELWRSWFRYNSLKDLLSNFQALREFRLADMDYLNGRIVDDDMVRPVDGYDALESGLATFRPIKSLAAFTVLKSVRLSQNSIGMPPNVDYDLVDTMTDEQYSLYKEAEIAATKNVLIDLLPCKSLEFLQIDEFEDYFEDAVLEFARCVSLKEYPNLKHVRLVGVNYYDTLAAVSGNERDLGPYHNMKSLVPPEYWDETEVRLALVDAELEYEAREFFRKAEVRFETLELNWPAEMDDNLDVVTWMTTYPQVCTGECGHPNCRRDTLRDNGGRDTCHGG
ncbi:hypothetical protein N8I77_005550 [Diaporthe amygdali]|uniref:F-box domain-containing protein n=1 Tax=Phomopsis amygdali TaxID=1214568 RepID=A0AAD9SG54_PHOAM|nr:hypothetical protein N8I77_005550 [Diaporthe amygdali]